VRREGVVLLNVGDARPTRTARLLEGADLPVERVAAVSGFARLFHFHRAPRAVPDAVRRLPSERSNGWD
jgi:transcriptional regulator GlxA family with amidase domain